MVPQQTNKKVAFEWYLELLDQNKVPRAII